MLEGARVRRDLTDWRLSSQWRSLPGTPGAARPRHCGHDMHALHALCAAQRPSPLPSPPDRKPFQVKDSSEVDASTTPPMMGTRAATTGSVGFSPRNSADSSTARGSVARAEQQRGGSRARRGSSGPGKQGRRA